MSEGFKFVDLFAGIGGFHAALKPMGGRLAHAVEIDPKAAAVYRRNWDCDPLGDITDQANEQRVDVPDHDVVCAGFPCQPFSKSGAQRGMDEVRGTLFWNIARIIEQRRPPVVLLENVRNLAGPRHRRDWEAIIATLRQFRYRVSSQPAVFSPHLLPHRMGGRPQVRERVFITASRVDDGSVLDADPVASCIPVSGWNPQDWNLGQILDEPGGDRDAAANGQGLALTDSEQRWLAAWDDFVQRLRRRDVDRPPGFPIWVDSWPVGAVKDSSPFRWPAGDDGESGAELPAWKQTFVDKNRSLYLGHQQTLDEWLSKWQVLGPAFPKSRRKFEWQAQDAASVWDCVIHLRPSGIRVKKENYLPALVAINQASIVGRLRRRLSPAEAARLQGLDELDFGGQSDADTYRQLGNGVNVGVVQYILYRHVVRDEEILQQTAPGLVTAVQGWGGARYSAAAAGHAQMSIDVDIRGDHTATAPASSRTGHQA